MSGGLSADGSYDSVYVGKMVNRDTTIAIERTFYAPRDPYGNPPDPGEYVVIKTLLYSADGDPHNHVTFGSVTDWNIPSDSVNMNSADVSSPGDFTYMQGVDTSGHENPLCSHLGRFGTDAFVLGWDWCSMFFTYEYFGALATNQLLLKDTNQDRNGQPIEPPEPDARAWWEDISMYPGACVDVGLPSTSDKATWLTVLYDTTIYPDDTINIWTVFVSTRDGTLDDLSSAVTQAKSWAKGFVDLCCCGCCYKRRGDANMEDGVEPTVGDIACIINMLFGDGTSVACLLAADVDLSGDIDPPLGPEDITVADISMIIDHMFGSGAPLPECPRW